MAERETISKKIRFEIFKRDSFTCQYCGASAPDVVLEIDHIEPVSKGGDSDITNLITSCNACNSGKSNRDLSDSSVINKRKLQLNELQERQEQLEMMLEWQKTLVGLDEKEIDAANELFSLLVPGYSFNDRGRETIRKTIKKHGLAEILECIRISSGQYLVKDADGKLDGNSVGKTFDYISKIANNRKRISEKPYLADLYYIRGIVRNRMYCNDWRSMELLETAYKAGIDIDELKDLALSARNWTDWYTTMQDWIRTTNGQ